MSLSSQEPSGSQGQGDIVDANISKVSLKIPSFWKIDPKVWFYQLECQFRVNRITSDQSKFDYVISSIDPEVLSHIYEVITDPPRENKYETVKDLLIAAYADSEQQKTQKLLHELELGDQRPSLLLTKMRNLANGKVDEEFLRTLWLQRLPRELRAIVSTGGVDLNIVSKMADQIWEMLTPSTSSNISQVDRSFNTKPQDNSRDLQTQIDKLVLAVERLTNVNNNNAHRNNRSQNKNGSRNRVRSQSPKRKTCFYHTKFGENANKCVLPCSMGNQFLNKAPHSMPENAEN